VTAPAQTVSDAVRRWAESAPDRLAVACHVGERAPDTATYAELACRAAAYADHFRSHGLRPGDAVVLLAHTAVGFVAALLGAQDAGLLAVPGPPREPLESGRRVVGRVTEILERSRACALVAVAGADAEVTGAVAQSGAALLGPAGSAPAGDGRIDRSPYSYCQFTSGSGGRAKGVLLTHENVAANVGAIREATDVTGRDVGVSWLPLYHDMDAVPGEDRAHQVRDPEVGGDQDGTLPARHRRHEMLGAVDLEGGAKVESPALRSERVGHEAPRDQEGEPVLDESPRVGARDGLAEEIGHPLRVLADQLG
jgi:AMP-binding enzyme